MGKNKCYRIWLSWLLVLLGTYMYDRYGLLAAFIALAISSMLRADGDESYLNNLANNKSYQYFSLVYYIILLLIVLLSEVLSISNLNGLMFVVIIAMPVLLLIIISDVRFCFKTVKK